MSEYYLGIPEKMFVHDVVNVWNNAVEIINNKGIEELNEPYRTLFMSYMESDKTCEDRTAIMTLLGTAINSIKKELKSVPQIECCDIDFFYQCGFKGIPHIADPIGKKKSAESPEKQNKIDVVADSENKKGKKNWFLKLFTGQ